MRTGRVGLNASGEFDNLPGQNWQSEEIGASRRLSETSLTPYLPSSQVPATSRVVIR